MRYSTAGVNDIYYKNRNINYCKVKDNRCNFTEAAYKAAILRANPFLKVLLTDSDHNLRNKPSKISIGISNFILLMKDKNHFYKINWETIHKAKEYNICYSKISLCPLELISIPKPRHKLLNDKVVSGLTCWQKLKKIFRYYTWSLHPLWFLYKKYENNL